LPPDQRPPAAGHLNGWRPDSGPDLRDVPGLLATRELIIEGRLPWSSNLTFLVTAETDDDADSAPLQAVYKPHQGEQSLWDFPDGLYRREVAAGVLSDALGWGVVPPTVLREDGPFGPGSVQLFVEADYEQHYFTLLNTLDDDDRLDRLHVICAFDVVANNADRKSGHVLVGPDGRLWGIDQGLCFHVQHKLRTVIWDFAGEPVPGHVVDDLTAFISRDLPADLEGLLSASEADAMYERAQWLVAEGIFPEPSEDHPPYPWPLV